MPLWSLIGWLAFVSLILSSCMVGPTFHKPPAPHVSSFTRAPLPKSTVSVPRVGKSGQAQYFIHNKRISNEWWELFQSKELNQLIALGLSCNRDILAAKAALRAAQEAVNVQIGALFPQIDLNFSGTRAAVPSSSSGAVVPIIPGMTGGNGGTGGMTETSLPTLTNASNIFNIFNANVTVNYLFDLWGGTRRQIEALMAQVDYQQFQLIATYVTLTSNIVTSAIRVASLKAQIKTTRDLYEAQRAQFIILKKQLELGGISRDIVLTQETLANQTRADIPPLEIALVAEQHALAVLTGQFPNRTLPEFKLESITLPKNLPVSIPSRLVRQRPDVRAAESLLHAANANIGVATANLFPQISLTGNYGWEATTLSNLFKPANKVWSYGGSLLQPFFHGGSLLAARRQAIALRDQTYAQYQQVVLKAFQQVADTLRALELDARLLQDIQLAEYSSSENLKLTQEQYKLGGTSYLALLNAQRQYQTEHIAVIRAKTSRYIDTATLFQALGGGWWHQPWCVPECV